MNKEVNCYILRTPEGVRFPTASTEAGLQEFFAQGFTLDPVEEAEAIARGVKPVEKVGKTKNPPDGE